MAHTWGTLLDYVRTGQPAYRQVFGRPFWEDLAAHPQIAAEFDALMGPAGIDMLVAGGKTNTLTQFTQLARQAGLEIVAARTQSSGRFVVECRPAA